MSTPLPSSSPPEVGEGQAKVVQNGFTQMAVPEQLATKRPILLPGFAGVRDTSSIPGVSMLAGQWYPPALFKHEEVVASKELFLDALNKFHTILGTRLTKKGRKGRERAAEIKTFQESLAGIPKLDGDNLDLHLLYVEVTSRGGLLQVLKDRKLKQVTKCFKFPDTQTSASYILRKYYVGLLYYFEQAYFFGKQGPLIPPPISMPGPMPKRSGLGARTYTLPDGEAGLAIMRKRKILPIQAPPVVDPAVSIGLTGTGAIQGKFEHGYLVTVTVGTEKLQGVLYHVPPTQRAPQHATVPNYGGTIGAEVKLHRAEPKALGSWRKRKRKEERLKKDPNAPRPNRTGYNFFFAEQRSKFKALHPEKDKELSRMIGDAWNSLTEEEKAPYQDRGVQDKDRYQKELTVYREVTRLQEEGVPSELATEHEPDDEMEDVEEAVVDAAVVVADAATKAATDSVGNAATDGFRIHAAMDVKAEPISAAEGQQQQPGSVSIEAPKPVQENTSFHKLPLAPYVTPKEEKL